jgi:hypothetical protein
VNMKAIASILGSLLFVATVARADWSATAKVEQINIGGNGLHGTFVSVADFSFTGCTSTTVGLLEGSNPNYKELISSLLAAKMADREVRLMYFGCNGAYSIIREVLLP